MLNNGHHLILGELVDYVTGATLPDTHDERYRQNIARMMVEQKGYPKSTITPRRFLTVTAGAKKAAVPVTFSVSVGDRTAMIIHYGPGSLVTRHRPALAMSRLATGYQVPVVVVTNGEQADILNGHTGGTVAKGLANLPDYNELSAIASKETWPDIPSQRKAMEARILMAYEIDDRCPCDTDVCRSGTET